MTGRRPLEDARLLVVEDDYVLADDLRRALAAFGATVVGPAGTVDDALDLVAETAALDGAVLDINLRGDMVFPVADALGARGVPFVFATGYDRATIPARYAAVARCEKPVDGRQVVQSLLAVLGRT